MKKGIAYLLTIILMFTAFCTTAIAEEISFIEECKINHTFVLTNDSATVSGVEKLWDDRTLITEEDIVNAEAYNSENEDQMYYALKVKINYFRPFMSVQSIDANGVETTTIIPDSIISSDASLTAICTDENFQAYSEISSADFDWFVVSVEKYDVHGEEYLTAAACNTVEEYNVSFKIPSKYSESTDLKMVKIMNGQVSYVDDIDFDATTYTVTATGSAAYVFVGTRNPDNNVNMAGGNATDVQSTQLPDINSNEIDTSEVNHNGKVVAPQTGDLFNPIFMLLLMLVACLGIAICKKNAEI